MGQAKTREKALRLAAIAEMEKWVQPATPEEIALARELSQKPIIRVPRQTEEILKYMRMVPQQCHENCIAYKELDPDKKTKIVVGWWRRGTSYVSHSIIERDGSLFCITPYRYREDVLDFILDPYISPSPIKGGSYYMRKGLVLPELVRLDPLRTIDECKWVRARLLSGMPVHEAVLVEEYRGQSPADAPEASP